MPRQEGDQRRRRRRRKTFVFKRLRRVGYRWSRRRQKWIYLRVHPSKRKPKKQDRIYLDEDDPVRIAEREYIRWRWSLRFAAITELQLKRDMIDGRG